MIFILRAHVAMMPLMPAAFTISICHAADAATPCRCRHDTLIRAIAAFFARYAAGADTLPFSLPLRCCRYAAIDY